jgi:hypothetical protein
MILFMHINDTIPSGSQNTPRIQAVIDELSDLFNMTDEGKIDTHLGIKISGPTQETIELAQPHLLIQQTVDDMLRKCDNICIAFFILVSVEIMDG